MSAFAIEQQVMCIKSSWKMARAGDGIIRPKFMHIYTVRAHCLCASKPAILLAEIHNDMIVCFVRTFRKGEPSFTEAAFAPLERLTNEIELETTA